MKVIDLGQAQPTLVDLLKMAGEENIVLRTSEGREFVLAETDDLDREIVLIRGNQELMQLLASRSREQGTISLTQAKELLGID